MAFTDILGQFTAAVEAGDGHALAALFTEDGVYHDTFYGEFKGRDAIQDMLDKHFWRDAKAFRWDMREPLEGGGIGYSNWSFSYESRLKGAVGKRILFEGMSRFRLNDSMIERYDEVFDMGIALSQTAFAPDRISRIVGKAADSCGRATRTPGICKSDRRARLTTPLNNNGIAALGSHSPRP